MILSAFTIFHVVLNLMGIGSGLVILTACSLEGWTMGFLTTTVATSVTGFLFPVHQFLPSHGVALLSLDCVTAAQIDGLKLHYVTSGHGPSVILSQGYTETSRMVGDRL